MSGNRQAAYSRLPGTGQRRAAPTTGSGGDVAIFAKGADPDALERSATRLAGWSQELEQTRHTVATSLSGLEGGWGGADVKALLARRPVVDRQLHECALTLRSLGERLRANAADQRSASGGSGSAGSGGAGSGGSGSGGTGGGTVQTAGATTPTPVDGYAVGPPSKPTFHWDETFEYDSASPGVGDWLSRAKWTAMLEGGKLARPDLDDALAAYQRYWDNSGEPLTVDYEEAYREDPNIAKNVDTEVGRTAAAVDQLVQDGQEGEFQVSGAGHASPDYPTTENWQKTLGAYQQWSSADVRVQDGMVTMTVTVHAEDHYNFNRSQADIATGASDDENGRFTELGWAKPFDTHGTVTRTVTWPVGHPPTDPVGVGDESRNPGREDRTDDRGNPHVAPGSDRDTGRTGSNR